MNATVSAYVRFTDITMVVDRSGSMGAIRTDAEGGINSFIEQQSKEPGEALLTLLQFNTQYEFIHSGKPIKQVSAACGKPPAPVKPSTTSSLTRNDSHLNNIELETATRHASTQVLPGKSSTMAPRDKVDDGNSESESSPDDQHKPPAEPTAPSEPTKKKIQIVDTTTEHLGMSIAIIGGIRAPRD